MKRFKVYLEAENKRWGVVVEAPNVFEAFHVVVGMAETRFGSRHNRGFRVLAFRVL